MNINVDEETYNKINTIYIHNGVENILKIREAEKSIFIVFFNIQKLNGFSNERRTANLMTITRDIKFAGAAASNIRRHN